MEITDLEPAGTDAVFVHREDDQLLEGKASAQTEPLGATVAG